MESIDPGPAAEAGMNCSLLVVHHVKVVAGLHTLHQCAADYLERLVLVYCQTAAEDLADAALEQWARAAASIAGCCCMKSIGPGPAAEAGTNCSPLVVHHAKVAVAPRSPHEGAAGCTDWSILAAVHTADAPVAALPVALGFVRAGRTVHAVRSPGSLAGGAVLRSHRSVVVGSWVYHVVAERGRRDSEAAVMAFGRRGSSVRGHSRPVCDTMRTAVSAGVYVELLDATSPTVGRMPTAGRMMEALNRCTLLPDLHWSSRSFGCAGDALLALFPAYSSLMERGRN